MKKPKYKPDTTLNPLIELPFGALTLQIFDNGSGYNLKLKDNKGYVTTTASLIAIDHTFGKLKPIFHSYHIGIAYDHYAPESQIFQELITPENQPNVIVKPDGTLWCTKCNCHVENTANAEMRKEGAIAYGHICK